MGMIDPVPGILFRTGVLASATGASAALVLVEWDKRRRGRARSRALLALAIGMLVLAGVIATAGMYEVAYVRYEERRFSFEYSATLEFNGTGQARITLPIPTEERYLAALAITPASASFVFNRSGAEPALDVTFSERTTVGVSFVGHRPTDLSLAANLTRTEDELDCYEPARCFSDLAVTVLNGSVDAVHLAFHATWGNPCGQSTWSVDAWVSPGARSYPGRWLNMVC